MGRVRASVARPLVRRALGRKGTVLARCVRDGLPIPRWGNLRRTQPFSENYGADRGMPVDRHYLERFLSAHAAAITGSVLEIQVPSYARRFGTALTQVDTVDINPSWTPTYLCDLAQADIIPTDTYDCFLLPATLQGLRDIDACLRHALRVVRPNGMVLASTAGFVPLMPDAPDYWRMSAAGWSEVAANAWPGCEVNISSYGNCLAATASMMGLAAEELTDAELDASDPRYPVVVTLACRKPQ